MVEMHERTVGPDRALQFPATHELAVAHQEVLQRPGGLRPQPHETPRLPKVPRRTVELEQAEAIDRHPDFLPGSAANSRPRPIFRMRSRKAEVLRDPRGIP